MGGVWSISGQGCSGGKGEMILMHFNELVLMISNRLPDLPNVEQTT